MKNIRTVLAEIIELPIPENEHTALARALAETLDGHMFDGMAEANPDDLPPTLSDAQKFLCELEGQVNNALLPVFMTNEFERPESVIGMGYKDIIARIACLRAKLAAIQKVHDIFQQ